MPSPEPMAARRREWANNAVARSTRDRPSLATTITMVLEALSMSAVALHEVFDPCIPYDAPASRVAGAQPIAIPLPPASPQSGSREHRMPPDFCALYRRTSDGGVARDRGRAYRGFICRAPSTRRPGRFTLSGRQARK